MRSNKINQGTIPATAIAPWIMEELQTADLDDRRLNRRLREVLQQLAHHPAVSIPAACGGHTEMTAAYRLFDNPKASFETILRPHGEATRRRMAEAAVVLLVQDTTELDLTRPVESVAGAGPLDGGVRRGVLLHPLHAFTPEGTPLGTLRALSWVRAEEVICANRTRRQRALTPIEQKESRRWVQMLEQAAEESKRHPRTQLICVADSEADIYELLAQGAGAPQVQWIVRACQDRAVVAESGDTPHLHLRERLQGQPVLFRQTIQVRGRQAKISCETRGRRQPRQSRRAQVEVRAASVTLRPPRRPDRTLPPVQVNGVLVREISPPKGEPAVQWLLLSSLPVATVEQVRQVIQYYCVRWMIEVFFRVLKCGCRVEQRQFEHLDRFLSCLAVYLIVAWRTLYLCRLGRDCPQISCEAVFEPAEWKAVWQVTQQSKPPKQPPSLGQMIVWVAQLGGYVHRPRSDPPGPQTLWIGLQRVYDFAICWRQFGPELRNAP